MVPAGLAGLGGGLLRVVACFVNVAFACSCWLLCCVVGLLCVVACVV